jgi:hypothetical protein
MIHIITYHYTTTAWLEIQKRHILKFTDSEKTPYRLYLAKYNLELPDDFELLDNWQLVDLDVVYPEEGLNEHYIQMNWVYENYVKEQMKDDDIIIFLDSDAFPCQQRWLESVGVNLLGPEYEKERSAREDHEIPENFQTLDAIVIHFLEDRGVAQPEEYYPYPDLCFFAATKKTIEDNNLKFYIDPHNPIHQNPGFGMKDRIQSVGLNVAPLVRTNTFNAHNVMFGVYGHMLYHQHCGSRAIVGRPLKTAWAHTDKTRHCYTGFDLYGRTRIGNWLTQEFQEECKDIIETNAEIFDIIYNRLYNDHECSFIRRYFMGKP